MAYEINDHLEVTGNVQVDSNLYVSGTITTNTFNVQNLVTPNGALSSVGQWAYGQESELNGKGFSWGYSGGQTQLIYRSGGRLWTNANIDLQASSSYSIDNIPVLSASQLGSTVTSSNLQQLGVLRALQVSGSSSLGGFAFFNDSSDRFGLGIADPTDSISIVNNGVQVDIGSREVNKGSIGTYTNHDFVIITDNLPRVTVKSTGVVNIGDPVNGGGALNVYGTIYAQNIQSDTRLNRSSPLQFNANTDNAIYGLGLTWSGTGQTRQLIMMSGPDRLWTSESFDIGPGASYYINGAVALQANGLGTGIVNSSLQSVGTLRELHVQGATTLTTATLHQATLTDPLGGSKTLQLTSDGVLGTSGFSVKLGTQNIINADKSQLTIGDAVVQSNPVRIFGPLSVNINNPDPTLQFSVNGDVNIGGKRFTNGGMAPITGVYAIGDICWNTHPTPAGHIGWICIASGTPGQWLPFGQIASQ
jgi:hypothetical protein